MLRFIFGHVMMISTIILVSIISFIIIQLPPSDGLRDTADAYAR